MKLTRIKKTAAQVLDLPNGNQVLISYSTPVAAFVEGRGYLRTMCSPSVTTSRHINAWIRGNSTTVPQAELDNLFRVEAR